MSFPHTTFWLVCFILMASSAWGNPYGEILSKLIEPNEPGVAIIVTKHGDPVYQGARGSANLEQSVPASVDSIFRIGSITKQFTAAAILLLEEQGKLATSDPLNRFIPDYPRGDEIRLDHLLTHTSGVFNLTKLPDYDSTSKQELDDASDRIELFREIPLEFEPGEKFKYSNSGYILLGTVVERASGKSYEAFIKEKITDRLSMRKTTLGNHYRVIPRRARGYEIYEDKFINARYMSMSLPHASGALLSTVGDLAKWNDALFGGEILADSSLKKMLTSGRLNDGATTNYGYGLRIGDQRGERIFFHAGGIFGYTSFASYHSESGVFIAILSNLGSDKRLTELWERIVSQAKLDSLIES